MLEHNPISTFLNEAEDLLVQIEEIALDMEGQSSTSEAVNQLFRAFHTIKGSGAMFGFDELAGFTHHVETVLDQVRTGAMPLSPELLNLVLAAKDQIKVFLDPAQAGVADGSSEKIITALNALWEAQPPAAATPPALPAAGTDGADLQGFLVRFRPSPNLMAHGTDPLLLLNEMRALGECEVTANTNAIPAPDQIQPDSCYLSWEFRLRTRRGINAIQDVFIFAEDGAELVIDPVAGGVMQAPLAALQVALAPAGPVKSVVAGEPPQISDGQEGAAKEARAVARRGVLKEDTVRVPSDKLDRLVNLVGELVMNQSRLTQAASALDAPNLAAPVEEIERLVAELRDNVLGIRMMPIGATFSRFKRLVHDLSAELGKEIELLTEGAETELDKTVLDQLGDPLVHLIRNSIDHGIEPVDERERSGKKRRGTVRLTAVHTGSNVIVSIQDDGRGIHPAVIRSKAIEKNLIAADAVLSDREILNLILLPGFSTAAQVTSVSGRGVGMDVVKREVEALRGSVAITSQPRVGTTISLTLPLTLAIIDGLLVQINDDQFIVPMSVVTENVELEREERASKNGRNVIAVRGELIPYIGLREMFQMDGDNPKIERIVVARYEDQRVGLVVDRVLGSHQTVIQSLGRFYRNIGVVSGATIMGDGRVALILDLAGLVRHSAAPEKILAPS